MRSLLKVEAKGVLKTIKQLDQLYTDVARAKCPVCKFVAKKFEIDCTSPFTGIDREMCPALSRCHQYSAIIDKMGSALNQAMYDLQRLHRELKVKFQAEEYK